MASPILPTLSKLQHLLTLLNQPRQLDSIARRVKGLTSELDKLHEARRKLGDTRPLNVALNGGLTVVVGDLSDAPPTRPELLDPNLPADALQKLDTLFNLLPRLEPLIPLTPRLLSRLRSLATLHASAATFASTLAALEAEVQRLGEGAGGMDQVLRGLEQSLAENDARVQGNLTGLETRIADVLRRMEALDV